jgi:TetR/AcrR family transcriptional regulator, transcriptional repressor of aconitase
MLARFTQISERALPFFTLLAHTASVKRERSCFLGYDGQVPKVSEEYRAQRRAHILAAARRCFVRNGFHETSMQDLVDEAGISSGALYRYFPSKDAVIESIAEQNLDQVVAVIAASVDDGMSAGQAVAAVLEFVSARHAEDGFAAIALLVWSEALRNPVLADRLRVSNTAAAGMLSGRARAGSRDKPSSKAVAKLLLCVLPGYLMQLAIGGPQAVSAVSRTVQELFPAASTRPGMRTGG